MSHSSHEECERPWWLSDRAWLVAWLAWGAVYPIAMLVLGVVFATPGPYGTPAGFRTHWATNVVEWLFVGSMAHATVGPFILGKYRWWSLFWSSLLIPVSAAFALGACMNITGFYL